MRLRKKTSVRLKPAVLLRALARDAADKSAPSVDAGSVTKKKERRVRGGSDPYAAVAAALEKLFPGVEREYRFHPTRRWRLDFAWVFKRVALEIEGGVWTNGRHTRGAGFIRDMEKYNSAAIRGWRILRCTPKQARDGTIYPMLFSAMDEVIYQ